MSYDLHILAANADIDPDRVGDLISDAFERDGPSHELDQEQAHRIMLEYFSVHEVAGWGETVAAAASVNGRVIEIELTYNELAGAADDAIRRLLDASTKLAGIVSGTIYDPQLDRVITTADAASMIAKYIEGRGLTEQAVASEQRAATRTTPWWKIW